ncbi:MFS general substrate transporter [Cucurbitaria berberidis CBS 394.84]|uniref:MFS general substrate transporter n=1 Tax=Cucurbitaria berberidis CBS 394.84 TaxID=1168544 RepID=A0A9P4GEL1_9PLEO|nr:MFS general substrate transporter [Cucurbitaria berberidis CBS 394.84]KAF1844588.1 MFS general substrate transporter [Cucurbitaria berberidis CBS 394.84]
MVLADEEQPLLRVISRTAGSEYSVKHDEVILDFEPLDPEDPRNWTSSFKWFIVLLLALMAFTVTFTCIGVVPVANKIVEDLDGKEASSSTSALLVTIWELGEAAGPLLIAPLSEVFGRYPVMNGCNIAFISASILAVSSQSSSLFITARMLTGVAVASNVLNPAIIGDMFESDNRGSAMSLIMLAPLIGGAIGPAISGAIAQTMGWREILIIAIGLAVLCEVLFLTCFRETYKMRILRLRIVRLQEESGEFQDSPKGKGKHEHVLKLWHSITRPFAVLFGSSVLMLLSLFGSAAFSFFYVISVSLPGILQDVYGLTPAQIGSAFMSFSVGSFLSVFVCHFYLDSIYIRLRGSPDAKGTPEYRLPLSIIGALMLPFSVTAYGWIAQAQLPVPLLLASVALLGFSLLLTTIPLSAYVVDACGIYSASAMTGVIVTRCLMGTFLPLTTGPLAEHLGYGWGFSCLGAMSLCLAIIPILLLRYGEQWRQCSEFTRDT